MEAVLAAVCRRHGRRLDRCIQLTHGIHYVANHGDGIVSNISNFDGIVSSIVGSQHDQNQDVDGAVPNSASTLDSGIGMISG